MKVTIVITDGEAKLLREQYRQLSPTLDQLDDFPKIWRGLDVTGPRILQRIHDALPPEPIKVGDKVHLSGEQNCPTYEVVSMHGERVWLVSTQYENVYLTRYICDLRKVNK